MRRGPFICAAAVMILMTGCSEQIGDSVPENITSVQSISEDSVAPVRMPEDITELGGGRYSCTFDGIKHDLIVDLPEETEGAPLVIMLPGSGNTAGGFRNAVHFEEQANPRGYAVVYITGASDPNDSTATIGWNSGIGAEGNDDVGFLTAMAAYFQDRFSFDKERTFAVGFSNGAFMTHRLAMEAGGTFSAAVSVAGKMPERIWEERKEHNDVGFFQITGEKDEAIPKYSDASAKYAKDPAIEDVMDYWVQSNGLTLSETLTVGKDSTLSRYTGESSVQVWSLTVCGGRHSWGDERITGIDTNSLILDFLDTQ